MEQVQKVAVVHCKVELGAAASLSLTSGANSTGHLSATVSTLQSTAASVSANVAASSPLLGGAAVSQTACGPLAEVMSGDSGGGGYCCHPAVADNSMHIGILVGRNDGKTRIPGETHSMQNIFSVGPRVEV